MYVRQAAIKFTKLLIEGDFPNAHLLICKKNRSEWPPLKLKETYENMIDYGTGPPDFFEVMETLIDWPDKAPDEVGWAYVAVSGPGFSEAIAVVVAEDGDTQRIKEIEWGRP